MNQNSFIEIVKKLPSNLKLDGFTFKAVDYSLNRNIIYQKEDIDSGYELSFAWTCYGDSIHISSPMAYKRFNKVEKYIANIFGAKLENCHSIFLNSLNETIPEGLKYSKLENNTIFFVDKEDELILILNFVNNFYFTEVRKFFNDFDTLEQVNLKLESLLEQKKIQSLLTSAGNSAILRFYVIAFICKSNNLLNFFNETYFPYLEANTDNLLNVTELEQLLVLKKKLTDCTV